MFLILKMKRNPTTGVTLALPTDLDHLRLCKPAFENDVTATDASRGRGDVLGLGT